MRAGQTRSAWYLPPLARQDYVRHIERIIFFSSFEIDCFTPRHQPRNFQSIFEIFFAGASHRIERIRGKSAAMSNYVAVKSPLLSFQFLDFILFPLLRTVSTVAAPQRTATFSQWLATPTNPIRH